MFSYLISRLSWWWNSRCGGREVLWLAIPMIISSGSWAILNFIDRVFLTWYSSTAAGTAFSAGMLFFMLTAFPFGAVSLITSFVAQYYGAGQVHRIGPAVWQGVFFALILAPLYWIAEPLFAHLFVVFGHTPELIAAERSFFKMAIYAAGCVIANEALQAFFIGRGKTQAVMVVNLFVLLVNVVLDYCWIFGKCGFPEWGIAGASLATTVSLWIKFFCFLGIMFFANGKDDTFHVFRGFRFDWTIIKQLTRFGTPSGLEFALEIASFSLFINFIGKLGKGPLAATSIAFNLNSLSFLPIIGMGLAVMSLVGNELGRNRPDLAAKASLSALAIGGVVNVFFVLLYLFFPDALLYAYMMYSNPAEMAEIHDMTVVILRFVAIYLLFDGINITFISTCKGAGDTFFLFVITLIMAPILPLACYIGIVWFGMDIYSSWIVLTVWICVFAMFFTARFIGGKWKFKRVIEPELLKQKK